MAAINSITIHRNQSKRITPQTLYLHHVVSLADDHVNCAQEDHTTLSYSVSGKVASFIVFDNVHYALSVIDSWCVAVIVDG